MLKLENKDRREAEVKEAGEVEEKEEIEAQSVEAMVTPLMKETISQNIKIQKNKRKNLKINRTILTNK